MIHCVSQCSFLCSAFCSNVYFVDGILFTRNVPRTCYTLSVLLFSVSAIVLYIVVLTRVLVASVCGLWTLNGVGSVTYSQECLCAVFWCRVCIRPQTLGCVCEDSCVGCPPIISHHCKIRNTWRKNITTHITSF